jgi:peptidoglycan/xylan/chitin deacetylase (PgdA/CDA1 family)
MLPSTSRDVQPTEGADGVSSCTPTHGARTLDAAPLDVALTFDDGPTAHTLRLLNVLAHHRVVATFFLVGERIARASGHAAVRRMIAEGHQVGNHSWSHVGPQVSSETYRRELADTDALLTKLGVPRPIAHRLPFGLQPADFSGGGRIAALDESNRSSVGWSAEPEDWKLAREWPMDRSVPVRIANAVQQTLIEHPAAPAIVLLHDQEPTAESLDLLLTRLAARVRRFLRLDHLPHQCEFRDYVRCGYRKSADSA